MQAQPAPAYAPPPPEPGRPIVRTYPAYPAAAPLTWPPPVLPVPGPALFGPSGVQGGRGTGVPGVVTVPVTAVAPPALPGGPHPLPSPPPCPLPWGFPNPFEIRAVLAVPAASWPAGPSAAQPAPGTVTVTGPSGYLPGIGYFDPLQTAAAAAPWLGAAAQPAP